MTLDEFKKGDKKLNINDIDILVNEQDSYHTDGAEVDYVDDFRGKGLVIRTGNGC
jgi:Fe-S cluster assembly iron-binding protein IscA